MKRLLLWLDERPALVLALGSAIFFLLSWGQAGISQDSATYAVIARNMAEKGSWFNPHYTEFVMATLHPPLVMWAQGIIFLLLEPNDSTARLFGALCAFGSILTVFFIGRVVIDKTYGFLAGLVLLLTYNFIQTGNSTMLDGPMTFFVLNVLLGIALMWKRGVSANLSAYCGAALAGAWLAKGVAAAPVFIAAAAAVLIWNRMWLKQKKFWIMPSVTAVIIILHLLLDYFLGEGRFIRHYFNTPLIRNFWSADSLAGHSWLQLLWRFVTLYLPFMLLVPGGLYLLIKKRMRLFYPALMTLGLYIFFYSAVPTVYYHYFAPLYALSAFLAAAPLYLWLRPPRTRYVAAGFLILWTLTGALLKATGVQIEHVRTKEIYTLNEEMKTLLARALTRHGLTIANSHNYDWVAKTAWYWRSDLEKVKSLAEALPLLKSQAFAYLLIDKQNPALIDSLQSAYANDVRLIWENERVGVFINRATL